MKAGPIDLGEIHEANWLHTAKPAIEERINRYSSTETHFALMSIGPRKSTLLRREIEKFSTEGAMEVDSTTIERLNADLEEELIKENRHKIENIRRRHNYLPLAITLIRALARKGLLASMRQAAVERKRANSTR